MNKYAAEVLGTFALVFAGTGAIVVNSLQDGVITHVGIALTFGLVVLAVIYSIGDISGAHINPAVTLGFWLARRFEGRHVVPYILCQLLGACAASALLLALFPGSPTLGATLPAGSAAQSFVMEVVLTWFLMYVVLCVSTGAKEIGVLAGVAVGSTVALEAMFAGPVCGASMNPARSLGPAVISGNLGSLWIYLLAPVIGAGLAVLTGWLTLGWQRVSGATPPFKEKTPEKGAGFKA
jgi:aquaporin NIP